MAIRKLQTAAQVIDVIGRTRVMEITGKRSTHLWNWLDRGNFPSETFVVLNDELRKKRCRAPARLWRMIEPQSSRAA